MTINGAVFLFGVFAFLLGSLAILAGYAAAAIEESEHERSALARFTLRICDALGLLDSWKEKPPEG